MIHKPIHNLHTYKVSYYQIHAVNSKYYSCTCLVCTCKPQHFTQSIAKKYPVSRLSVCICVISVRQTNPVFSLLIMLL